MSTTALTPPDLVTLTTAERATGLSATTLRRMADDGRIRCVRTPGGRRRLNRTDVDALAERMRTT